MSVRKILRIGDPLLRQVAEPVTKFATPELDRLIEDMFDTMRDANGAGLAAPQIGVSLRVMIFGCESNPRYPGADPLPETILINPAFRTIGDVKEGMWEGCLSVPGMRGYVERPSHIEYRGVDGQGRRIVRDATGFHAGVFQHEFDHLDGVLYPDLIRDHKLFGFIDELTEAGVIPGVSGE